ncbi:PH domain-containing protein [Aliidiomarina sp. Khilg15.8]
MQSIHYKPVNTKYKTQLRIEILINWGLLLIAAIVATVFMPSPWHWLTMAGAAAIVILALLLMTLWVPRRYKLTGYAVEPLDVHYRTGALWRQQTAVPVNRIQHVEITQGPIERVLSLARLVIYTAGGSGSDLAVPGLLQSDAEALRDQLLRQIGEEPEDEHPHEI